MLSNKEIERHYFGRFRNAYAALPDGLVKDDDEQETPDVIIEGPRKVGIEITRLYREPGSLAESEQRQRPLRDGVLKDAQGLYLMRGGKNIDLWVGFGALITPSRRKTLPDQLASFIAQIDSHPTGQISRGLFETAMPEISSIYFNACEYQSPRWQTLQVHTVGLMDQARLEAVIQEKETKQYEQCDILWLLIIADSIDTPQGQEIRIDGLRAESRIFAKIIIYDPTMNRLVHAKCHPHGRFDVRPFVIMLKEFVAMIHEEVVHLLSDAAPSG